MNKVKYVIVSQSESGQKLMQFLDRRLQGQIPRSALMRWIRSGQVRVDSSRSKPYARLNAGQKVRIPPYTSVPAEQMAAGNNKNPFLLRKVYEDENILVVAKPPNLPTQLGTGQKDSVDSRIKKLYAQSDWIPALVHRLDKETSGLLVLAKTYHSLQRLQKLWIQGFITKAYLCWVKGQAPWPEWTQLIDTLYKTGSPVDARCRVKTLRKEDDFSLVAVRLDTGRRHQIRIQLSRRGHPVMGDRKYAGPSSGQGLLLHSWRLKWEGLDFTHLPPWTDRFAVSRQDLQQVDT